MGLDNGLRIRGKTIKGKKFLDEHFKKLENEYSPAKFDFDYWRKCWNMRTRFLEVFSNLDTWDEDKYEITLNISNLYDYIERVLKFFLDEKNWNYGKYGGGSIWEWHDMLGNIAKAIFNLREFIFYTEHEGLTDEDFDIRWYDSY